MITNKDDENVEDEEAEIQSNDDLAGADEICRAIEELHRNKSMEKRLIAIAALILQRKRNLKRQFEPEDLLQEAIQRIWRGLRAWPKNRVDFPGLVIGTMRSWASSLEKKKAREDDGVLMEHELGSAEDGDGTLNLEDIANDSDTPLGQLEAQEHDAKGQSLFVILKARFKPQDLEGRILNAISKKPFESHLEVRSALQVEEADYRNAWKALMRAANKLEHEE